MRRLLVVLGPVVAIALGWLAPAATAQRPRVEAPLIGPGPLNQDPKRNPDEGIAVQMFESPNVDRFLHKAQDFLQREDWLGAIRVLQDVLEGRTLTDPGDTGAPGEAGVPADPKAQPDAKDPNKGRPRTTPQPVPKAPAGQPPVRGDPLVDENPINSVFSADRRLYRPVGRLCHELLAAMAEAGQSLYREKFEFQAQQLYEQALAARDRRALEDVYQKHFITLAAGRAMLAAGDLLMAEGRHRAAIQTFRLLLEVYPVAARARIGEWNETYVRLRVVACHQLLGDRRAAGEALAELVKLNPEATVRLQGEIVPVASLAQSELFGAAWTPTAAASRPGDVPAVAAREGMALVPLWEHRYGSTVDAYRSAKTPERGNEVFMMADVASRVVPAPRTGLPGTSVTFDGGRILFADHFRLRAADALRGWLVAESDGPLEAPQPQQNRARSRVPVYDWLALRPVVDEERAYLVIGHRDRRLPPDMQPVLHNELVAVAPGDFANVWSSTSWNQGRDGARVTFLAAPVPFGDLLLVPVLDRGAYGLLAVHAATGAVRYRTLVHASGTEFVRAPAPPVQVNGGVAYVLTNAGVLAALDAYTGVLLWARRYERLHPFRPGPPPARAGNRNPGMMMGSQFREASFPGFLPSELHVREGRVIFAPADGKVFLCLDGASGEPIWMMDRPVGGAHPTLLGCNRTHAFLLGSTLTCVDHRTGIAEWELDVDGEQWWGRGLVTDDAVILPGERSLRVLSLRAQRREWRRVPLPPFSQSEAALQGACNVFAEGPYVALCYEGGIEVYGDARGLHELARASTDPLERSAFLVQAGDLPGAIDALDGALRGELDEGARSRVTLRMLALAREAALAMIGLGSREPALALLARVQPHAEAHRLLGQWHLARMDAFKALQDEHAVAAERQAIAAWMEGRR